MSFGKVEGDAETTTAPGSSHEDSDVEVTKAR